MIKLTDNQRQMLRGATRLRKDYSDDNKQLDAVIAQIKIANPKAFHDDVSRQTRVFINEPRQAHHDVPRAGSLIAAPKGI